jgi:CBS domain-containing protein
MMLAPSGGCLDAVSRRHHTVEDVMTTSVVTADRLTPYKEIARLLAEHRISGLPVLVAGWQVVGVVSEADLLEAQDKAARQASPGTVRRICRVRALRHPRLVAAELMSAPPVTIHPDATIPAAVRAMNTHHVRRLPVTGADHQLIGIVSRRDLLSVFLRPDTDINHDVRRVLDEIPLTHSAGVIVTVRHGVVTVTGTIQPVTGAPQLVTRLIWDVDGVVDVVTRDLPGRADPAAGEAGRDDPHEQLPLPARPGLDSGLNGRRALGLGFHVVRRSLDQHAPALAPGRVDLVDLERHLVIPARNPGLQVLIQRAVLGGPEHDRPVVPLVVHRQHRRTEPALVGDAADSALRYQPQALGLIEFLDRAVRHA